LLEAEKTAISPKKNADARYKAALTSARLGVTMALLKLENGEWVVVRPANEKSEDLVPELCHDGTHAVIPISLL
jgi:hypothetical protein